MSPSSFAELANQYVNAVQSHVQNPAPPPMQQQAQTFSRSMLSKGMNVLDLTSMHQIALVILMSRVRSQQEQAQIAHTASAFFMQTLAPFTAQIAASASLQPRS